MTLKNGFFDALLLAIANAKQEDHYGKERDRSRDGIAKLAPSWVFLPILGFALVGGVLGALLANALIKKHFAKAGVV